MTTRVLFLISIIVMIFISSAPALAQFSPQFDLLKATEKNDTEKMQTLLSKGVSANTRRKIDGYPALLIATSKRYSQAMTLLLKSGGDPDIQSRERGETALMNRAEAGDVTGVRLMLEYKANVDKRDKAGESALLKAVRSRKSRTAQLLVEAGANPNFGDATGNTALSYARQTRSKRMIKMLEDAGAKD